MAEYSRQFDKVLNREQAKEAVLSGNLPDVVQGDTARSIMRAANVRSWPIQEMASQIKAQTTRSGEGESLGYLTPSTTVHTAQSHLHLPTLRKYINYDEPETDPDTGLDYHPTVLHNQQTGSVWMDEGHHRLIASRLRGDLSREVWSGSFRPR